MKFSYSWLKDFVIDLPKPRELAELLTTHSFEVEDLEERKALPVRQAGQSPARPAGGAKRKSDWVLDLDILPNRMPDAASHFGVAREISALLKVSAGGSVAMGGKNKKGKVKSSSVKSSALVPFSLFPFPFSLREDAAHRIQDALAVKVEDSKLCPRYSARVVFGVKVGPSPKWLAERLATVGVGSINNIVDATNYVMLELGQPLHAFDFEKIESVNPKSLPRRQAGQIPASPAGRPNPKQLQNPKFQNFKQIIVRTAKDGETIETLDGKRIHLDPSVLLITDAKRALAIAGIKGGRAAEISGTTKNIVLESANFDAAAIRRASQKLGIHTDASLRFEHGLDQNLTALALERVASLIQELAGGVAAKGMIDVWPRKQSARHPIGIQPQRVSEVLGVHVPQEKIRMIFEALGCAVKRAPSREGWLVEVPSSRLDLTRSEDLIEEVARIIGYDWIKPVMPLAPMRNPERPQASFYAERVRDILTGTGFYETATYALVGEELLKKSGFAQGTAHVAFKNSPVVSLLNPPSEEFTFLAPSLLPRLLEQLGANLKIKDRAMLFELAKRFESQAAGVREYGSLALGIGAKTPVTRDSDFFFVKGAVSEIAQALGVANLSFDAAAATPESSPQALWHPTRVAEIKLNGEEVGFVGEIHPNAAKAFGDRAHFVCAEIDSGKLLQAASEEHEYREPSRYPEVLRDIALLAPRDVSTDTVASEIVATAGALLRDLDLFDYYEGEGIPEGKKNLAFHLFFQSFERTLKAEEVDEIMEKIYRRASELGWEVR